MLFMQPNGRVHGAKNNNQTYLTPAYPTDESLAVEDRAWSPQENDMLAPGDGTTDKQNGLIYNLGGGSIL